MARLAEAAASVDAARYGPIAGDADLRAADAGHLAALSGGDIAAADVAITAGCNMGFVAALMLVAKAGDAVLLPSPWYFNHEMTAGCSASRRGRCLAIRAPASCPTRTRPGV